jgi:hypothetical protein
MGKKESHKRDLYALIDALDETTKTESIGPDVGLADHSAEIAEYLVSQSALPGRRANLELAAAFGDIVEIRAATQCATMWALCSGFSEISADEAPANTPREFLPFCGAIGIGAIGSVSSERRDAALTILGRLATDTRWRLREAVCFGLQRMLGARVDDTLAALFAWLDDGNYLRTRAAVVAVAEPTLLKNDTTARSALELHREAFEHVLETADRRSEEFRILRKGLAFTLSVLVQACPQDGFELMARLAQLHDADVTWILRQNLKKNRLIRNHPERVAEISRLLQ